MPMMNGVFCCLFCMVDAGQRIVRLIGAGWWQGYFLPGQAGRFCRKVLLVAVAKWKFPCYTMNKNRIQMLHQLAMQGWLMASGYKT